MTSPKVDETRREGGLLRLADEIAQGTDSRVEFLDLLIATLEARGALANNGSPIWDAEDGGFRAHPHREPAHRLRFHGATRKRPADDVTPGPLFGRPLDADEREVGVRVTTLELLQRLRRTPHLAVDIITVVQRLHDEMLGIDGPHERDAALLRTLLERLQPK